MRSAVAGSTRTRKTTDLVEPHVTRTHMPTMNTSAGQPSIGGGLQQLGSTSWASVATSKASRSAPGASHQGSITARQQVWSRRISRSTRVILARLAQSAHPPRQRLAQSQGAQLAVNLAGPI